VRHHHAQSPIVLYTEVGCVINNWWLSSTGDSTWTRLPTTIDDHCSRIHFLRFFHIWEMHFNVLFEFQQNISPWSFKISSQLCWAIRTLNVEFGNSVSTFPAPSVTWVISEREHLIVGPLHNNNLFVWSDFVESGVSKSMRRLHSFTFYLKIKKRDFYVSTGISCRHVSVRRLSFCNTPVLCQNG